MGGVGLRGVTEILRFALNDTAGFGLRYVFNAARSVPTFHAGGFNVARSVPTLQRPYLLDMRKYGVPLLSGEVPDFFSCGYEQKPEAGFVFCLRY